MPLLGIEFNDSVLTGVTSEQLVFAESGCALVDASGAVFGATAQQAARIRPSAYHDRYWRDLSEASLARGGPELETGADVAFAQLQGLWGRHGSGITEVAYAVPSWWQREQLALLLGLTQEAGIPLTGLVEIPVAASRRTYGDSELLHIEAGLHATSISRMQQGESIAVQQQETVDELGTVAAQRTCAEYFARRFLECNRFDPLHDAESEQGIYDQLDEWIALLNRNNQAELNFTFKGNQFTAEVSLAELRAALQLRFQSLIQSLRAQLDFDKPTALQLSSSLALYPGVAEALADLPGCDVFVMERGAAARGLVQRASYLPSGDGAYSITASLPCDQPPAAVNIERAMASPDGAVPTHLVLDGHAYRLSAEPLRIGAEGSGSEYSLVIDGRHQGVSRRHCSIELNGGRAVLNDHSRFGTRLNGHLVAGSAVLQPGDVISIGDPACDLKLTMEIAPAGQQHGA